MGAGNLVAGVLAVRCKPSGFEQSKSIYSPLPVVSLAIERYAGIIGPWARRVKNLLVNTPESDAYGS